MFVYVYKILPAVLITQSMNGKKKKKTFKPNIRRSWAGVRDAPKAFRFISPWL